MNSLNNDDCPGQNDFILGSQLYYKLSTTVIEKTNRSRRLVEDTRASYRNTMIFSIKIKKFYNNYELLFSLSQLIY